MNKNTIGLAFAARKTCVGADLTIKSIQNKKAYLVILANDASELTKKTIYDKCKFYQVDIDTSLNTIELSKTIGKENIKVIGILDKGFAESIKKQ